jgi:hypothetical protein
VCARPGDRYVPGVDRQAIARARRAKQVREQLADERDREAALQEQLEDLIGEADGPALDEQLFAQMDAEEAKLVRDGLFGMAEEAAPEESFWSEEDGDGPVEEDRDELEEEIARLEREVATCRRRQQAYERYLELLGE